MFTAMDYIPGQTPQPQRQPSAEKQKSANNHHDPAKDQ
jgi:hypothetical protein